jgi:hypothetical protein
MRTLEEIYGRCVLDDIAGCKLWRGCTDKFGPRIYAPDMRHGGQLKTQYGRRAVWQLVNKQPLPKGWRVFGTCGNPACLEYKHIEASTTAARGRKIAESGAQKGLMTRIVANRKIGKKRSVLTNELIAEIRSSPETGSQLVARLGIGRSTISKVRTGQATSFAPVGGIFTGLLK